MKMNATKWISLGWLIFRNQHGSGLYSSQPQQGQTTLFPMLSKQNKWKKVNVISSWLPRNKDTLPIPNTHTHTCPWCNTEVPIQTYMKSDRISLIVNDHHHLSLKFLKHLLAPWKWIPMCHCNQNTNCIRQNYRFHVSMTSVFLMTITPFHVTRAGLIMYPTGQRPGGLPSFGDRKSVV